MSTSDGHLDKVILQCKIINMICNRFEKVEIENTNVECFILNNPTTTWMKPVWEHYQKHQYDLWTKGHLPRDVVMMWENVRTLPVEFLHIIFETTKEKNFLMKFVFYFRRFDKIEPKEFRFTSNVDRKINLFYGNWRFISFRDNIPFVLMFNELIEQFGDETL